MRWSRACKSLISFCDTYFQCLKITLKYHVSKFNFFRKKVLNFWSWLFFLLLMIFDNRFLGQASSGTDWFFVHFSAVNSPRFTAFWNGIRVMNMRPSSLRRSDWRLRGEALLAKTSKRRFISWRRWNMPISSIYTKSTKMDKMSSLSLNCEFARSSFTFIFNTWLHCAWKYHKPSHLTQRWKSKQN